MRREKLTKQSRKLQDMLTTRRHLRRIVLECKNASSKFAEDNYLRVCCRLADPTSSVEMGCYKCCPDGGSIHCLVNGPGCIGMYMYCLPFHLASVDWCLESDGPCRAILEDTQAVEVAVVDNLSRFVRMAQSIMQGLASCRDYLPSEQLYLIVQFVVTNVFHRSTAILWSKRQKCAEEGDHSCDC